MKWRTLIHRPNGVQEINAVKARLSESMEKQGNSARRLSRAAETVSRHREEEKLAKEMQYFRIKGAL